MAQNRDQLITEYVAVDKQTPVTERATRAVDHLGRAIQGVRNLSAHVAGVAATAAKASAAVALLSSSAAGLGAVAAFREGVGFLSLNAGLEAIAGSSKEAAAQLARLKEVARAPGLGFEEAIQGSINLQGAGLSARLAERSLAAFGNALATTGGSKDDLAEISRQLAQIQGLGRVTAENLNVIRERAPIVSRALQSAFGTVDTEAIAKMGNSTEFIERLVGALEEMPKATGGVQNTLDNIGDTLKAVLLPAGVGLARVVGSLGPTIEGWLSALIPISQIIGDVASAIARSGVAADALSKSLSSIWQMLTGLRGGVTFEGLAQTASRLLSAFANAPEAARVFALYIEEAATTLWANVVEAFDYAQKRMEAVIRRFGALFDNLSKFLGAQADEAERDPLVRWFGREEVDFARNLSKSLGDLGKDFDKGIDTTDKPQFKAMPRLFDDPNNPANIGILSRMRNILMQDAEGYLNRIKLGQTPTTYGPPAASDPLAGIEELRKMVTDASAGITGGLSPAARIQEAVERTAANTGALVDLQRQITGGGTRAALGVPVLDLFERRKPANNGAYGRGGPARIRVEVPGSTRDALLRAFQGIAEEVAWSMARIWEAAPRY